MILKIERVRILIMAVASLFYFPLSEPILQLYYSKFIDPLVLQAFFLDKGQDQSSHLHIGKHNQKCRFLNRDSDTDESLNSIFAIRMLEYVLDYFVFFLLVQKLSAGGKQCYLQRWKGERVACFVGWLCRVGQGDDMTLRIENIFLCIPKLERSWEQQLLWRRKQ